MPELAACQSAQVQAVLTRRVRRPTLPPWSIPQGVRERALVRSVSRTSRQWRAARWPSQPPRGNRRRWTRQRCHPVVHTSLGEIAIRAVHLGREITLPEVRLGGRRQRDDLLLLLSLTLPEVCSDCHSDNFMHLRIVEWRMVGVGEISGHCILQLLQNTNDLADACVNFHHSDNSRHCARPPQKKNANTETRKARCPHAISNLS